MASLIDTLIETLENENTEYLKLLELSQSKTQIIVEGDLEGLEKITDEEQSFVGRINTLEHVRMDTMQKIAKVLNTDVNYLKLENLISLLDRTPREQVALAKVHDKLRTTLKEMKLINERNEQLLNSAIEMVNFNLNLIQSMKTAPETANYNRGAYSTGSAIAGSSGSFDAKQ